MLSLSSYIPDGIRIKHRRAMNAAAASSPAAQASPRLDARHPATRRLPIDWRPRRRVPTVLDPELTGDPWLEDLGFGLWALCLDDTCLACIRGVDLDLPSLNRLLDRVWKRPPRYRR
jgi:hypothetical protein